MVQPTTEEQPQTEQTQEGTPPASLDLPITEQVTEAPAPTTEAPTEQPIPEAPAVEAPTTTEAAPSAVKTTTEPPAAPTQPDIPSQPQSLPGDLDRIRELETQAANAVTRQQQAEVRAADEQANQRFLQEAQAGQQRMIATGMDAQEATSAANQHYSSRMAEWNAYKAKQQVQQTIPNLNKAMGERVDLVLRLAEDNGLNARELFTATRTMDGTQISAHAIGMTNTVKMQAKITELETKVGNQAVPANQTFDDTKGTGALSEQARTLQLADPNYTWTDADTKWWSELGNK